MFKKAGLRALCYKILCFFVLLILGLAVYVWQSVYAQQALEQQSLMIPVGASSFSIAHRLEQENIITSALHFRWLSRLLGVSAQLKSGLYNFDGQLNTLQVLAIVTKGEVQQFKLTIPEGLRTAEMLDLLAQRTQTPRGIWQQAMLKITQNNAFEGLFLPETYHYNQPIDAYTFLQQMFDGRIQVEAVLAAELGWSEAQIVRNRIMASIVEKETALAHERVWVSAAIHNRLRLHMPLQMDPTVIYGMYQTLGDFSGNIRRQDLRTDTPWNTYTRRGLPPTPIANPGAASLRAAAYPAAVDYLYFVADGTGGHAFASTLAEHNANVQQWIRVERQRK